MVLVLLCSGMSFKNKKVLGENTVQQKNALEGLSIDNERLFLNSQKISITKREMQCYLFLLQGKSANEIGNILCISPRTVETHILHIKEKLCCNSRSDLFSKALRIGLIKIVDLNL